ncbi:hypothetical protein ACPEEZ_13905 [Frigoribacterium sp. 2-23]|uniref:hypothetical protein n=1 Tax=Frigoribacterium sp. 2-23 TaxID=3415006 RepID=UPI003C7039C1
MAIDSEYVDDQPGDLSDRSTEKDVYGRKLSKTRGVGLVEVGPAAPVPLSPASFARTGVGPLGGVTVRRRARSPAVPSADKDVFIDDAFHCYRIHTAYVTCER